MLEALYVPPLIAPSHPAPFHPLRVWHISHVLPYHISSFPAFVLSSFPRHFLSPIQRAPVSCGEPTPAPLVSAVSAPPNLVEKSQKIPATSEEGAQEPSSIRPLEKSDSVPVSKGDSKGSEGDLEAAAAAVENGGSADEEGAEEAEVDTMGEKAPSSFRGVAVDDLSAPAKTVPSPNLGVLLLGFLQMFGQEIDLARVRLMLKVSHGMRGKEG